MYCSCLPNHVIFCCHALEMFFAEAKGHELEFKIADYDHHVHRQVVQIKTRTKPSDGPRFRGISGLIVIERAVELTNILA